MEQEKKQGSKELRKESKRKQEKARESKRKQARESKRKQEKARESKTKQDKTRQNRKATESNRNPLYKGDGQSVVVAMVMGVEVSPEAPLYVRTRAGSGTQAGNMTTRKRKGKG